MPDRKKVLVSKLIAYLQEHGPADLSLRPMAAEVGTSARLLIYHFGSKEKLLAKVLTEMQARLRRSFEKLQASSPAEGRPLLRAFWDWALEHENFGHLRLFYQLHVLALRRPGTHSRDLKQNSMSWIELVQSALPASLRTPAMATLFVAVFDGLFLELMSTGDRVRTTRAIDEFIRMARASASSSATGPADQPRPTNRRKR